METNGGFVIRKRLVFEETDMFFCLCILFLCGAILCVMTCGEGINVLEGQEE